MTLGEPRPRGEEFGYQNLGEQPNVVVEIAGIAQLVLRAWNTPTDTDDGAAALGGPLRQFRLPRRPGEDEKSVVGGLRQVDVDVAPVAGLAADRRQARPLAQHQRALLC